MAAVLGLLPEIAAADEIRHTSFASFMVGTYAASGDRCGANDKSAVTITETKFTMADDACDVRWIVETIGRTVRSSRRTPPAPARTAASPRSWM